MSVHVDAERQRYVVRWRQDGRNRSRRFKTADEAAAFEQSLAGAPAGSPRDGLSAMEARLAELEAKLAAGESGGSPDKGGVYAYMTKEGRRWYFNTATPTALHRRSAASRRGAPRCKQSRRSPRACAGESSRRRARPSPSTGRGFSPPRSRT